MKRLVEFPMEDGSTILVEVDEPGMGGGTLRSGRAGEMIERASVTYEEALGKIQPATVSIISRLRLMPEPPSEIAVELGISLSAEAGAFIASATTQAHLKLTLTWVASPPAHSASQSLPSPHSGALTQVQE
ncbi:MAG: CU044_2847 family protein [Chloroflexia bacterium]